MLREILSKDVRIELFQTIAIDANTKENIYINKKWPRLCLFLAGAMRGSFVICRRTGEHKSQLPAETAGAFSVGRYMLCNLFWKSEISEKRIHIPAYLMLCIIYSD